MRILTENNLFIRAHKSPKGSADIWFVHGFGESGLCFREAFSSPLAEGYNLFVPDFPGFGVSPYQPGQDTVQDSADLLERLIQKLSPRRPIVLLAHSLGGIIGTWLAAKLDRVVASISVEGNLTKSDTFFSGLAAKADSPQEFHSYFAGEIYKKMAADLPLQRYYASLRLADPRALIAWGRSGVAATGECRSGEEFAALKVKKCYLWGDKSTPKETWRFIEANSLPNRCFRGAGHWPMIDQTDKFYETVLNLIVS